VEMHHGTIRGESAGRGHGTTFVIDFPLAAGAQLSSSAPPSTADSANGSKRAAVTKTPAVPAPDTGRRARVLVVDDHAPTLAILTQLLNRRQFDVIAAGTAAEARAMSAGQEIDLFISDIGLPDGNGCALMTELREKRPELVGIALSGYGMEEDRERSRLAGFVEHLTKPVNVGALDGAISRVFGERPAVAASPSTE
ncbi:MAG: multi-sensor hybrid histidine kinase, partial [Verrucomicrobia bacterium]|nr:multi-sensor hybrid histidine kinase [Verrucomicrobiota bacterium]